MSCRFYLGWLFTAHTPIMDFYFPSVCFQPKGGGGGLVGTSGLVRKKELAINLLLLQSKHRAPTLGFPACS